MKKSLVLYISIALVVLGSCSGFEKLVKSTDYEKKYAEAKRYYEEEDFYKAQVLYDQIAPIMRGTDKADTVYFYQALCYYKQSDYIMAGHYFDAFSRVYGASPFLEEADFFTAYCYYKNSPRPELDQQSTLMSLQAFQKFLIRHPGSERKEEALAYIDEMREKQVEKSFISARLYYDLEDYKASLVALNNSLSEFPESKHREQILFMVFKSSFKYAEKSVFIKKKERYQVALDDYYSFKAEYPESKFMREANRYYASTVKYLGTDKQEIN